METAESSSLIINYYIQPGRKGAMFTLWRQRREAEFVGVPAYVCNLTKIGKTSNEKAIKLLIEKHRCVQSELDNNGVSGQVVFESLPDDARTKKNHSMPTEPLKRISSYLGWCINHYGKKYNPVLEFSKYSGKTLYEVEKIDRGFFNWLLWKSGASA